jgi:predicted AAA+ superfamily ATPase
MVKRTFWHTQIERAWLERPVLWLTGVRRVGKTTLAKGIKDAVYFDCELPRVRRLIEEDPEGFLEQTSNSRVILDEVHRVERPSELLKIAADHFPNLRLLATGSSTLGASHRFRDTLAGRKRHLHLAPVLFSELKAFGADLKTRMFQGGLPENLISETFPEKDFVEWIDAFWARDIQELFRLEKRTTFMRLLELLLTQSGQLCELNSLTSVCGASRQTLSNYLGVLEATGAVHVLRPFFKNPQKEIVSMPKVYGFDTGFVCHARGWRDLRHEDFGGLWEHLVLDELRAHFESEHLFYWRDKRKREMDFVLARRGHPPIAIECKWKLKLGQTMHFSAFQTLYPSARLILVTSDGATPYFNKTRGHIETGLSHIKEAVALALAFHSQPILKKLKKRNESDRASLTTGRNTEN